MDKVISKLHIIGRHRDAMLLEKAGFEIMLPQSHWL